AGLSACIGLRRTFSLLCDDRNHPANGVRPVEAALGAAQHLDTRDIAGPEVSEIDRTVEDAWVAHLNAVDQNLHVIGIGAAHESGCLPSGAPGLDDVESRPRLKRVRHRLPLIPL